MNNEKKCKEVTHELDSKIDRIVKKCRAAFVKVLKKEDLTILETQYCISRFTENLATYNRAILVSLRVDYDKENSDKKES